MTNLEQWINDAALDAARRICSMDFWKYARAYGYSIADIERSIKEALEKRCPL